MEPAGGQDKTIDLLGYGIAAVDDVIELEHHPAMGSKMPVERLTRHGGGQCTTALVAAARLGQRCVYAGPLGDDELSVYTRERLREAGVRIEQKLAHPAARPYHSFILVDRSTQDRTILYSCEGVTGPQVEDIDEELICRSRMLMVDQLGPEGTLHACRLAREQKVPIVADLERVDCPALHEVLALTDHAIFSRHVACVLTGASNPEGAIVKLAGARRACTAVTDGARGCWFATAARPGQIRHQPAFAVEAKDTTGCGDVFHGAYAAALLMGMEIDEAICLATATSAMKAMHYGGQAGIPDLDAVRRFLHEHGPLAASRA